MTVGINTIPLGLCRCFALRGSGVIVIDAGQPGKGRQFASGLGKAGISPEEVQLIVLTHGHWDHVGSAKDIRSVTGAPIAIHHRDARWLAEGTHPLPRGLTAWGRIFIAAHRLFSPLIRVPTVDADLKIGDEEMRLDGYGIPGSVVHTPGHSPGSVSVLLDSGEAFVGDMAMNGSPLRLSPGLAIFGTDEAEMVRSWRELIDRGAETVYPAHGEPFPVSHVIDEIGRRFPM